MNNLPYNLLYVFIGAWRRRYIIILPILILPLVGLAIDMKMDKRYESHTSMLIQETSKMNPFLEDFAVSAMLKERLDALQTLLHSRHILGIVALDMGLLNEDTTPIKHDQVIAKLSNALTMSMVGKDLIRIEYSSSTPEGMKETLEAISTHFIEQLLAPERSSMKDSAFFLAGYLDNRRDELEVAEANLARFKELNADSLPELHNANADRLAKLKMLLAERQAELAGVKKSLGGLSRQLSQTNPIIGRLEEQIVSLRGDLTLLNARYTDKHSRVQAILRELTRLEDERQVLLGQKHNVINAEQLWDMASSVTHKSTDGQQPLLITQLENLQIGRSKIDFLTEEILSLNAMVDELEKSSENYGEKEEQIYKLERELKIKHDLYEELLHRYEMAKVTRALGTFEQGKRIKIIDRPFTPVSASSPSRIIFLIAGIIAGIVFGCGIAVVLAVTDTTIGRRDILEKLTGAPVLTRIPPLERGKIIVSE